MIKRIENLRYCKRDKIFNILPKIFTSKSFFDAKIEFKQRAWHDSCRVGEKYLGDTFALGSEHLVGAGRTSMYLIFSMFNIFFCGEDNFSGG